MPLFDYECLVCHDISEQLQRLTDPPPHICEKCGAADSMAKIISKTTFQLKGGGWHKDLYSSRPPADF
jgi:putative FmdB family regulatory protein